MTKTTIALTALLRSRQLTTIKKMKMSMNAQNAKPLCWKNTQIHILTAQLFHFNHTMKNTINVVYETARRADDTHQLIRLEMTTKLGELLTRFVILHNYQGLYFTVSEIDGTIISDCLKDDEVDSYLEGLNIGQGIIISSN